MAGPPQHQRRGVGGGISQTFGSCMYCLKCKETPSEKVFLIFTLKNLHRIMTRKEMMEYFGVSEHNEGEWRIYSK